MTKDLKNSPTRMRIISTVKMSMCEMSSMAPLSMSYATAGLPVRYMGSE